MKRPELTAYCRESWQITDSQSEHAAKNDLRRFVEYADHLEEEIIKLNKKICPDCREGRLEIKRRDQQFEYEGKILTVEIESYVCPECLEEYIYADQITANEERIKAAIH